MNKNLLLTAAIAMSMAATAMANNVTYGNSKVRVATTPTAAGTVYATGTATTFTVADLKDAPADFNLTTQGVDLSALGVPGIIYAANIYARGIEENGVLQSYPTAVFKDMNGDGQWNNDGTEDAAPSAIAYYDPTTGIAGAANGINEAEGAQYKFTGDNDAVVYQQALAGAYPEEVTSYIYVMMGRVAAYAKDFSMGTVAIDNLENKAGDVVNFTAVPGAKVENNVITEQYYFKEWQDANGNSLGNGTITRATNEAGVEYTAQSVYTMTVGAPGVVFAVFTNDKTQEATESTTAIENVADTQAGKAAPCYDLVGRRVDNNYRGIVVQNGRKFVRR